MSEIGRAVSEIRRPEVDHVDTHFSADLFTQTISTIRVSYAQFGKIDFATHTHARRLNEMSNHIESTIRNLLIMVSTPQNVSFLKIV